MAVEQSRFSRLITLAQAPDSETRRELLREVTDLFFDTENSRQERETLLMGDILHTVAADMQDDSLIDLATRFASRSDAPEALMISLASRPNIAVAGPVLRKCSKLRDDVLVRVIGERSQDHIKAVAERPNVSEVVSAAIVDHGDDLALDTLVRNPGATIARPTMEKVVDRARHNQNLHEGVVTRSDLPLDLLNEMYFVVETRLRQKILEKNATVDRDALDAALMRTRAKMAQNVIAVTEDVRKAQIMIAQKKAQGLLDGRLLVALYRDQNMIAFYIGLAELTGIDADTARSIIERKDIDALAMICRAANMERALFVTMAVLCSGGSQGMAQAEAFGRVYLQVPVEAAQRAMRFFKVRKSTEASAAA
jgi:uncharacterized protein (DUF2336 family)